MKGLKKKVMSVLLTLAMVASILTPMSASAAIITSGDEYITMTNGMKVKLTVQMNGPDGEAVLGDRGQYTTAGTADTVFDGDKSTVAIYRKQLNGWGGEILVGDYIQVEFKTAISLKDIEFCFENSDNRFDRSTVSYTTDGETWIEVATGATIKNNAVSYVAAEEIQDVKAVRLTSETAKNNKFITISEIVVNSTIMSRSGYEKISGLKATTPSAATEGQEGKGNGIVGAAVDGNKDTFWHSAYDGSQYDLRTNAGTAKSDYSYIELTLPEASDIAGVTYLARQLSGKYSNGAFRTFKVQVKTADGEWTDADIATINGEDVTTADFAGTDKNGEAATAKGPYVTIDYASAPAEEKEIIFTETKANIEAVKFVVKESCAVEGPRTSECDKYLNAAEISVLKQFENVVPKSTINVSCEENQGTVSSSATTAVEGDVVTLTAAAAEGYRFVQWETADGELVTRESEATVTIGTETEYSYVAKFKANNNSVTNVLRGITLTNDIFMDGTQNSEGRPVTWINDGTGTNNDNYVDLKGAGSVCRGFEIDLGKTYTEIDSIKLFRYHGDTRSYRATLIQVANQADFSDAVTVYCASADGSAVQGVKATETTYTETNAGKTFVLPENVSARYVRFFGLSNGTASNSDVHILEFEVYAVTEDKAPLSNLVTEYANLNSADYTTESWSAYEAVLAEANALLAQYVAANEGEVEALCTKLTDAKNALESLVTKGANWINVELDAASIVNGLSIDMTEETYFGAYKVYVSTDKDATWTENADAYTLVCEGTWDADVETKTTAFKSIANVYQVCLVATDKEEVVIAEPTITTVAKVTEYCAGGSLRMDYGTNYDATCLRFVYTFPETMNGLEADTWFWNYGLTKDLANKKVVESGKWGVKDGLINSNIVFTNVDRENYDTTVYTKLTVTYSDGNGNSLTVYDTVVAERSVNDVANAIERAWLNGELDSTKENQYNYALGILGRPVSAQ